MSVGNYTPPVISVEYDLDSECWQLMATNHARTATAGERLFRAPPHPAIAFSHPTESAALKDAAILRAYLADCASGRRKEAETVAIGADYWEE